MEQSLESGEFKHTYILEPPTQESKGVWEMFKTPGGMYEVKLFALTGMQSGPLVGTRWTNDATTCLPCSRRRVVLDKLRQQAW